MGSYIVQRFDLPLQTNSFPLQNKQDFFHVNIWFSEVFCGFPMVLSGFLICSWLSRVFNGFSTVFEKLEAKNQKHQTKRCGFRHKTWEWLEKEKTHAQNKTSGQKVL